jgi:methylated-DNA-protein-cysteine methyltransferase-like protein
MDSDFRREVFALVAKIPEGRVMTYGDIALICGYPYAARQVGGIAHWGPDNLPWHRVVNRFGDCASGYPGGKNTQQAHLESEGIVLSNFRITDFESRRWLPHQS